MCIGYAGAVGPQGAQGASTSEIMYDHRKLIASIPSSRFDKEWNLTQLRAFQGYSRVAYPT